MKISKFSCAAIVLLLSLGIQCVYSAWEMGQTTDETYYTATGYAMVRHNNYDFLGEQPPLIPQIGALPLLALQPRFNIQNPILLPNSNSVDISKNGADFLYKQGNNPHTILFLMRLPIIGLTLLLGLAVLLFGRDLFGKTGGLVALALYAFDPNIIAHGSLYTTDLGLAAFYFFSIYALKNFFQTPAPKTAMIAGIFCGLTFLSKISGLVLFPVAALLFLCFYFKDPQAQTIPEMTSRNNTAMGLLAFFLLANSLGQKQPMVTLGPLCLLAVFLCFENRAFLQPRHFRFVFRGILLTGSLLCFFFSYKLKKKYGIHVAAVFLLWNVIALAFSLALIRWGKGNAPLITLVKLFIVIWLAAGSTIILDYTDWIFKIHRFIGFGHFVQPLGIVLSHSMGGHRICVDGSFVTCDWRYFFGVGAVKIPLLTLLFAMLGLIALLFSKRSLLIKGLILIPPLLFLGAAVFNGINIGLRHVLPVYPFLFIWGGFFAARLLEHTTGPLRKSVIAGLGIALIAFAGRSVSAAPNYLAYVNEWVGTPEQGAGLVADSNLNWGQDNAGLAEWAIARQIPHLKIHSEAANADVYDYYKISWSGIAENDLIQPAPGFYALGVGIYADLQKKPESWFKGKKPLYIVSKTFYIFQVQNLQTNGQT